MRVVYKTKDERMQITFDGKGIEDVVTCLAQIQDILENTTCGACGSTHVALERRVSQGYTFYAAKCLEPDCGAKLEFGQRKDESGGGLYTKRWDTDAKQAIEHDGWTWYKKGESSGQQQQAAPVQTTVPVSDASPVDESEIPFAVAFAFLSASLIGGMAIASQDVLQVLC